MNKFIIIFIAIFSISSCKSNFNPIKQALKSEKPSIKKISKKISKYDIQIKLTVIDSNKNFNDYEFRVKPKKYFYPASTVKLPIALFAMEKINEIDGIDLSTPFKIEGEDYITSLKREIEMIFAISSNKSSNRLFELLGQDYINQKYKSKGINNARMFHRLSTKNSDNINTKKVVFLIGDSIVTIQTKNKQKDRLKIKNLSLGKGHIKNGRLISKPMDFSEKNFISIDNLHYLIKLVFYKEKFEERFRFNFTSEQYDFIKEAMSIIPSDIGLDKNKFPDNYVKNFIYGDISNIDKNDGIEIYNKTGSAYGHMTEVALIKKGDLSIILTATINVNTNQIYNDNNYDYSSLGSPFFAELSREIIRIVESK